MGSKLKAAVCLVMMFALGTVSGAVVEFYRVQHVPTHTGYASHRLKKLKTELGLSTSQEQALKEIFEKANQRAKEVNEEVSWDLNDIHEDSVEAIHGVLSPEQNQKFEQLHHKSHIARATTPLNGSPEQTPNEEAGQNS